MQFTQKLANYGLENVLHLLLCWDNTQRLNRSGKLHLPELGYGQNFQTLHSFLSRSIPKLIIKSILIIIIPSSSPNNLPLH